MINLAKLLIYLILSLMAKNLYAQDEETDIKREAQQKIRAEFPSTRILNFEYNQSLARDFESELFGENFQEGEIQGERTLNAAVYFPFYQKKKMGAKDINGL